jgi:hypothetical protein
VSGRRVQAGLSVWPRAPGPFLIVIRHPVPPRGIEIEQQANPKFLPLGVRGDAGARSVLGDATRAAP